MLEIMQASIPYSEICRIVADKYDKKIQLAYAGGNTITATLKTKVAFITLSPTIQITIDEAKDSTIALSYDGGFGVDAIVGGAITFLRNKVESIERVAEFNDKHIKVHLDRIAKLKNVFQILSLDGISFDENAASIRLLPKNSPEQQPGA